MGIKTDTHMTFTSPTSSQAIAQDLFELYAYSAMGCLLSESSSTAITGHFYTTDKNKRTIPDKIEIKKFDPVVRKHVIYKEAKIK